MSFSAPMSTLHYGSKQGDIETLNYTLSHEHYGSQQGDIEPSNYTLSHELGSERSEWASERMSSAERTSKASSAEQVNEWVVRTEVGKDKLVARYSRPDSWLIWTTVRRVFLPLHALLSHALPSPTHFLHQCSHMFTNPSAWMKNEDSQSKRKKCVNFFERAK